MNLRILLSLVISLAMGGCAEFEYARDVAPTVMTNGGQSDGEIRVVWRFGTPEYIHRMCSIREGGPIIHGCAARNPDGKSCVIYVVQPRNFQDDGRLAVLGHEFWHCLGARHL